jgi:hypothetical protein
LNNAQPDVLIREALLFLPYDIFFCIGGFSYEDMRKVYMRQFDSAKGLESWSTAWVDKLRLELKSSENENW